jgi:metal-dependent amidase/aminoacylase/carboxypeptidase family protein
MTKEKDKVRDAMYAQRDRFVRLAHEIHEHPQLAFTEEYAAARIAEVLADEGFAVRTGVFGMPTAFIASFGNGPLHVAFCAEYDALPPSCLYDRVKPVELMEVWLSPERQDAPLRHACGHNIIAGAAVAAATSLRDLADAVGLTVSVFGTPGEELIGLPEPLDGHLAGGKIAFLEAGAFERVHAALMVHPWPTPFGMFAPTHVYPRQRARFSGAGADGRPLGVAEMRLLEETLQRTVTSLHQVPALYVAKPEAQETSAQADLLWIAPSLAEGMRAGDVVRNCFKEAASAAGITVEVTEYPAYSELRNDPKLSASYRKNARALGRVRERDEHIQEEFRNIFSDARLPLMARLFARFFPRLVAPGLFLYKVPVEAVFGTDLANVSQVIPAIHPLIGIGGMAAPHSAEFAAQADTDEAYRAMLDGGVALAWTALDAATDTTLKTYLLESASSRVGSSPTTV